MMRAISRSVLAFVLRVPALRLLVLICVYGAILGLGVFVAYQLRFDFNVPDNIEEGMFSVCALTVAVQLACLFLFHQFDGLLINLPGRPPNLLDQLRSIEKTADGERLHWKNDQVTFVPEDDNPRTYSPDGGPTKRADFATIDPDKLTGIETLTGYWWNTLHVPWLDRYGDAAAGGLIAAVGVAVAVLGI